jgi:hypothetical protein
MIATSGAPFDQGRRQGGALRIEIETAVRQLRADYGWWRWYGALRRARSGPGRMVASFLPQQHERLQGIAHASGLSLSSLELLEALQRVDGVAAAKDAQLHGSFEIPPELEAWVTLRCSEPDAGGFRVWR